MHKDLDHMFCSSYIEGVAMRKATEKKRKLRASVRMTTLAFLVWLVLLIVFGVTMGVATFAATLVMSGLSALVMICFAVVNEVVRDEG